MDLTTRLSLYYSQQSEKEIRNCSTSPAAMKLWGHVSLNPVEPQCDQENKENLPHGLLWLTDWPAPPGTQYVLSF